MNSYLKNQESSDYHLVDINSPELYQIISYPHFNYHKYLEILTELEELKITKIILHGKTTIGNNHIIGKECNGLVIKVIQEDKKIYALKIRRIDSSRKDNKDEISFMQLANSIKVGPKLIGFTKNTILMEFIEGSSIKDWSNKDENISNKQLLKKVLNQILFQAYIMDINMLDHGELSYIDNHIIISDKNARVTIIDFESSSISRKKPNNLTSAIHSLFLKGYVASQITKYEYCDKFDNNLLYNLLKNYKTHYSINDFERILDFFHII